MKKDLVKLEPKVEEILVKLKKQGYQIPPISLIKSQREIDLIKESGLINTGLLDVLERACKVGVKTSELNDIANEYYKEKGAIAAPLNYGGFPASICTSINEVVCHGIPGDYCLKEGDIINIDVSTIYQGYFSDASRMIAIGSISEQDQRLIDTTKQALALAIEAVKPYKSINVIGDAIEKCAKENGVSIVRELGGHGIGLAFHEEPFIYHYARTTKEMVMVPGMIFTIEPMLNSGKKEVFLDSNDGWTIYTKDQSKSAQVEHLILVTENGAEILSY